MYAVFEAYRRRLIEVVNAAFRNADALREIRFKR
jgi:hypothetical protein